MFAVEYPTKNLLIRWRLDPSQIAVLASTGGVVNKTIRRGSYPQLQGLKTLEQACLTDTTEMVFTTREQRLRY